MMITLKHELFFAKNLRLVEQLGSGIPRILEYYDRESFHFSENFVRMISPFSVQAGIERKMDSVIS
ncbi:hypothetical protein GO491_09730 [Flavobacteriaceae bacterium Ap0902]|nr:hypothetical protein [Flavobacteriaceae bacterium Ap0902]